jgi:hypothetical protein
MGMKVLFITWAGHAFARSRLARLKQFHHDRGDNVGWTNFSARDLPQQLDGCELAYVWNGAYNHIQRTVIEPLKQSGCKIVFVEIAWFPQGEFLYFDKSGTNGNCSLFDDDLSWLEDFDFRRLDVFSEMYRGGRSLESKGYIFAPLQLSSDTQITHWSPYKRMDDFIDHCREKFRGMEIIFRKHPKDRGSYARKGIGSEGEGDLRDLICGAELVYGINSTVILEAALIGKPVAAIGKCLINIGDERRRSLAALLARQVPISATDFGPWIRPGRGLEHLS